MEDSSMLKIKIGPHEFEASGSADAVREQFQAFKEMVALLPKQDVPQAPAIPDDVRENNELVEKIYRTVDNAPASVDNGLHQITKVDGRTVSLTARPKDISNAILLILYGHKVLLQNEGVTGAAIIPGLKTTGGYSFERIDRTMERLARDGYVLAFGENRGKRYRLTNKGIGQARLLATEFILSLGGSL